jgi:hypothetical protein
VNKRHTNTESIAEVTTSAGLTSLASPCRAKGASQTFGRYGKNGVCFCHHPVLVGTLTCSAAVNRRSRRGPERCRPVISSHFSFGAAPQVGQRTANICFGLSPALIGRQCPKPNGQEWSMLNSYEQFPIARRGARCRQKSTIKRQPSEQSSTTERDRKCWYSPGVYGYHPAQSQGHIKATTTAVQT